VALRSAKQMKALGYPVAPDLATEIFRCFLATGRAADVTAGVTSAPQIEGWSPDARMLLANCCSSSGEVALAWHFWQVFQEDDIQLCPEAHKIMLKMLVSCGDHRALAVFEQLAKQSPMHSANDESFLLTLLNSSVESKFASFAEKVVSQARKTIGMSARLYGACIRVYAADSKFAKACCLYDYMESEGLRADAAMRRSLLVCASQCSRDDISEALSEELQQSLARRVCALQCLFAAMLSAFCLCMLGALSFLAPMPGAVVRAHSAGDDSVSASYNVLDDISFVVRMLFGPFVVTALTFARSGGCLDNVDNWQHALFGSALLI